MKNIHKLFKTQTRPKRDVQRTSNPSSLKLFVIRSAAASSFAETFYVLNVSDSACISTRFEIEVLRTDVPRIQIAHNKLSLRIAAVHPVMFVFQTIREYVFPTVSFAIKIVHAQISTQSYKRHRQNIICPYANTHIYMYIYIYLCIYVNRYVCV